MARCFCGCGRDVPLRRRAANRRGARVDEELRLTRVLAEKGLRSPAAAALLRDGDLLRMQLADAVHTGTGPSDATDREARELIELAHEHFGPRAFGKALKREKLQADRALEMIERGEWDPFARAPLPPAAVALGAGQSLPEPPPHAPEQAGDLVAELERLARMHAAGALSDEEFKQAKRRLLEREDP